MKLRRALLAFLVLAVCNVLSVSLFAQTDSSLRYELKDKKPNGDAPKNLVDLKDPPNIKTIYKYDPTSGSYLEIITIGGKPIGSPRVLTLTEYLRAKERRDREVYYRKKSNADTYVKGGGIIPKIAITPEIFDKVFGGGIIDIRPSGSAEVTFGGNFNKVENPSFPVRQQKNGQFDFGMKMQLNVTGQIGDRLKLNWNYDTEATFEFENQMKLNWAGGDDDIVKNIELGNVSLPLNGSLIQGGRNLFGVKTQLQFGKLKVAIIATQDKGETKETEVTGGAQVTNYDIQAHNYDVNRHYFLSQYFAQNYDNALTRLPIISSNIQINYVEVWVTNRNNAIGNSRNVMGFMDLGENENNVYRDFLVQTGGAFPDNNATNLYSGIVKASTDFCSSSDPRMVLGTDYECLSNARKLNDNEFSYHPTLGYISLNQSLNNDELLMVAYEYIANGARFQVGELSVDNPLTTGSGSYLNLKLLKHATIKTNLPAWELMMKNIYSLNTYNLQREDFTMNVVYADDPSGADLNYLPVEPSETEISKRQLITVLNLDKINKQQEAKPDGVFDLIDGVTIDALKGRIIFPVREPFGSFLRSKFKDASSADYYVFDSLYRTTKWNAEQDLKHNKYFLRGTFKGSSSDQIRLQCYNISQGSVRVTANGNVLSEGSDYIVDYTLGTVKIVNQGILNSGAAIKATCESNSLINIQQKSLIGTRLDYKHSDKLILGATFMHMSEQPLTNKVNIGEEPLRNSIWGFDGSYNTESRFLTRMVDKLPFIETKEVSSISITGEFAHLIPHKAKTQGDKGTSYIDDFEGAETPYDLKYVRSWRMASTPQGQPDLFPETANPLTADSSFNSKRANLSWYNIDPVFQGDDNNLTPENIRTNTIERSGHWVRTIVQKEIFPDIELQQGQPQQIPTLDLSFYPDERGQYNYNTEDLLIDGSLDKPKENWGGIMRRIETNDFEATNIDYIELWLLDPFVYSKYDGSKHNTGDLYINIGSVSEDVIQDRKRSAENGLPVPNGNYTVDEGKYAFTPNGQIINKAFDNTPEARTSQDVGLDGMNDDKEREVFKEYLDAIAAKHGTSSAAYQIAQADPSGDNYIYPRDPLYDNQNALVLPRYKKYNGFEGNSTLDKLADGTPKSGYTIPDDEDINQDYTVNLNEEYFQYRISIDPNNLKINENYVTDSIRVTADQIDPGALPNEVTWYQLKIPIRQYEKKIGGIQDFKSIRFMRMFVKGFEDSVVLRFANFQLVRANWRRYLKTLKFPPRVGPPIDPNDDAELVVSTVNVNENSKRSPIPYVVPPGFSREIDPTQVGNVQQNEQSLSIEVRNLDKEDAKGAYRALDYDIRNYKTLKMFVHAESQTAMNGDVVAMMRIGTDLESNFYQYEVPLIISPEGVADPSSVWPSENEIIVDLEEFYRVKLNRQLNNQSDPNGFYSETLSNGHKISIVGLPDLSNVRTILLGVKNSETSSVDKLSAEVWFNELRLVDFANKGGYAANARLVAKLADFANVTVSGNYQTIGFGAIDKKLNERNLNEQIQYDIASNIELGKFFPQKSGITVPMFIGYSENIINPKFYPLNPDILLRTAINNAETQTEKDGIRQAAQDYSSRYSLNFTNVKKNRTAASGGKPHFYDIENWNYSFAYQRLFRRSQVIERNDAKTYKSSLGYNFSPKPKSWEPFKRKIKSKRLTLIKDFNIGLVPTNLNFRVDVNRRYSELMNRDNDNFKSIVPVLYDKTFSIGRLYGWKWNLTKSLSVDYAATANSWVEEPEGELNTPEKKQEVWDNFWALGRLNNFNQTVNANYSLPLRKIKILNWTTVTTRYSANYEWRNAPPASQSLGNTIQNSRTIGVNTNFNFISLYNKVPFLRKINRPPPRKKVKKDVDDDDDDEKKKEEISAGTRGLFKFLMMLKQAQMGITKTDGTTLPGFTKSIDYIGQNFKNNTPGLPFVFGSQDENFRNNIAAGGFLTTDTNQIARYINLNGFDLNGSATLEPIKGFRISINFNRRQSLNVNSNFRYQESSGSYDDIIYTEIGTFSTSFGTWSSMFDKLGDDYSSATFTQFKDNRYTIALRLQARDFGEGGIYSALYGNELNQIDDSTSFPKGYGNKHQEVLLHSFIAAYSGKNASTVELTPFKKIPIPNWRITYNGLSKLDIFKDIFSNISISHAYSSTLTIGSFQRPLDYGTDDLERGANLATQYLYQSGVTIVERLTPLIGIDVTTKDGISAKFEFKTDRNLQLNVITARMVEVRNKEYVIGAGYRTSGLRLPIKMQGKRIILQNDLNIRFDFSIRDGITIVRTLEGNDGQDSYIPTAGIRTMSIRPSLDYKISDALNFRMFYNRNSNNPVTSNSFPSALTDFGVTLRYTLQ
ncbi:MAG: cell surface protein SprA [Bacteroidetes bacterium]|nr:MAG: cell surface protein SprA [Bacteroidota bacterium]